MMRHSMDGLVQVAWTGALCEIGWLDVDVDVDVVGFIHSFARCRTHPTPPRPLVGQERRAPIT